MTWREEASTERRARQRASRWLRPILVAALILRCTTVFGAPAGDDEDRKLDGSLRHRVRQGSSSENVVWGENAVWGESSLIGDLMGK